MMASTTIMDPASTETDDTLAAQAGPLRLKFDEDNRPVISLPPPTTSDGRSHQRSKTIIDLPPLSPVARKQSISPTRSTTFLPFRRISRSVSPQRSEYSFSSSAHTTSDSISKGLPGAVEKITSWFEGTSEPVNISFIPSPKKDTQDLFYKVDMANRGNTGSCDNFTQRPTKRHTISPSTANSSMFSFFRKSTIQVAPKSSPDDMLDIDIPNALLPDGPVEAPTADSFKALQLNAETLIRKLQSSYAENLNALKHASSERSVQADELEASQTRNEHLKLQLLEMAERAAEQEKRIVGLREQLNKHQQSIRMIAEDEPNIPHGPYRRNRQSDCSSFADSMADTDISSAVSIFSDIESLHTPAASATPSPVMKYARLHSPTIIPHPAARAQVAPVLVAECSNCHGVPAAEAWDVIGVMKAESVGLKQRVIELENAQDAALDFLSGLQI